MPFFGLAHKKGRSVKEIVEVRSAPVTALIEAVSRTLDAVSAWEARGFFGHCRYCSMSQLL
jgi:hypothetical protein